MTTDYVQIDNVDGDYVDDVYVGKHLSQKVHSSDTSSEFT